MKDFSIELENYLNSLKNLTESICLHHNDVSRYESAIGNVCFYARNLVEAVKENNKSVYVGNEMPKPLFIKSEIEENILLNLNDEIIKTSKILETVKAMKNYLKTKGKDLNVWEHEINVSYNDIDGTINFNIHNGNEVHKFKGEL